MKVFFQFNTHRPYSAKGQIIQALATNDDIYFLDATREIAGVAINRLSTNNHMLLQDDLLRQYDSNLYEGESFSSPFIREIINHFSD